MNSVKKISMSYLKAKSSSNGNPKSPYHGFHIRIFFMSSCRSADRSMRFMATNC